jgi:hypothetical protein
LEEGTAVPQTSDNDLQKQIDELKKEKDRLDAEKAKLDAQKALADSQKALDQAKNAAAQQVTDLENQKALADAQKALADSQRALDQAKNAATRQVTDLENQKALADAQKALADSQKALDQAKSAAIRQVTDLENQKALADAQKALADAQSQAALAKYIGDVKAGPYSGSVTMKDKAGTEEALLLGARAVKECAVKVAKAVRGKASKFYIFGATSFPNFHRLLAFRFRKELIKQAFAAADIKGPEEPREEMVTAGMVSAGLDAFSNILGFFKTDYEIGGMEVKIDESLLLFAVAGNLSRMDGALPEKEVHLSSVYEPNAQKSTITALTDELAELVYLRSLAANEANQMKDTITETEKRAADSQNATAKDALLKSVAELKSKLDQLNGTVALYDSFASALTAPDSTTGAMPLSALVQEFAIDTALKTGGAVLLLRIENSGGGYLLKKNLLTALWKMPLYHMGGATVTYLLLDGAQGKVLAGDVIPVYGGFVKTDDLRNELRKFINDE